MNNTTFFLSLTAITIGVFMLILVGLFHVTGPVYGVEIDIGTRRQNDSHGASLPTPAEVYYFGLASDASMPPEIRIISSRQQRGTLHAAGTQFPHGDHA